MLTRSPAIPGRYLPPGPPPGEIAAPAGPLPWARSRPGEVAFPLLAASVGAGLAYVTALFFHLSEVGLWAFAFAILGAICIDWALWVAVVRRSHHSFTVKVGFVVGWIMKAFPLGACIALGRANEHVLPAGEFVMSRPFAASSGLLVLTLSAALILTITKGFENRKRPSVPIMELLRQAGPQIQGFLIVAALLRVFQWIAVTGFDNPIFYIARILNTGFTFVPFVAGFLFFRYRKAGWVWVGVLIIQLFFSYMTGARGMAFTPIIFFLVGFFLGLPNVKARLWWGTVVLLPITLFLASLAVGIGATRDAVGRTDILGALRGGALAERAADPVAQQRREIRVNRAYDTFRRLSSWPVVAIPAMTPEPIPFRGFDDFGFEVRSITSIGFLMRFFPAMGERYYFSNIFLRPYAFAVHIDPVIRRPVSNVEFPVAVDGFTRAGWSGAFFFVSFFFLLVFSAERFVRFWMKKHPHRIPIGLMMLVFLSYLTASRMSHSSFVDSIRQLLMEGPFMLVFLLVFSHVLATLGFRHYRLRNLRRQ